MHLKYLSHRTKYWPEIEQFFSTLPPRLFRQGVLLKNNLATFYSNTGQFKDILCQGHNLPLLYLHFWLLDDFNVSVTDQRTALEKHLFLAMTFTFASVYTHESIFDAGSQFDKSFLFLERTLTQQANFHLAQLYFGDSPFWEHRQAYWFEYTEAFLAMTGRQPSTADVAFLTLYAEKLAFTKIPIAAVAVSANQENILPQLCMMMNNLNIVFQTIRDISTIRRDIMHRTYTYPIIKTMQEAGLDPTQAIPPERILGALVLTGTIDKIGQECLTRLETCRQISTSLNLPTFTAYWNVVKALVTEIMALFSLKPKAPPQSTPDKKKKQRPFFAPAIDTLPKVIEMAEGYLLSDLTFRESWEVQRRGIFGASEVTGQAFPAGLITEILCRQGYAIPAAVNTIFDVLQATGYRYYDDDHLPPDTDDLGLLLRLYPYSPQPDAHRQILQTPLPWLEKNLAEFGEISVWLIQNDKEEMDQQFLSLWGKSCTAVEANLLMGLIVYDWDSYCDLIEKSALNLCERWQQKGLGATLHYVPLYSLWVTFELMAKLAAKPILTPLQNTLIRTTQTLAKLLTVETKRSHLTPQDAALLMLSCFSAGWPISVESLFNPAWVTILTKSQRYDGSWPSEPLFGTPTRGELATWYASRSVTTAFCYHALKTYAMRNR